VADEVWVGAGADEGFWLGFSPADANAPTALRIWIEEPREVDAVTGASTRAPTLCDSPQNYLVCPPQAALDGVCIGVDCVAQFVTRAPGAGACSLLVITAIPPIAQLLPPAPLPAAAQPSEIACEGIRQRFMRDPYGSRFWDTARASVVRLRILAPDRFAALTGTEAPGPLDERQTYQGWRLP
jgi:hypothetical protein